MKTTDIPTGIVGMQFDIKDFTVRWPQDYKVKYVLVRSDPTDDKLHGHMWFFPVKENSTSHQLKEDILDYWEILQQDQSRTAPESFKLIIGIHSGDGLTQNNPDGTSIGREPKVQDFPSDDKCRLMITMNRCDVEGIKQQQETSEAGNDQSRITKLVRKIATLFKPTTTKTVQKTETIPMKETKADAGGNTGAPSDAPPITKPSPETEPPVQITPEEIDPIIKLLRKIDDNTRHSIEVEKSITYQALEEDEKQIAIAKAMIIALKEKYPNDTEKLPNLLETIGTLEDRLVKEKNMYDEAVEKDRKEIEARQQRNAKPKPVVDKPTEEHEQPAPKPEPIKEPVQMNNEENRHSNAIFAIIIAVVAIVATLFGVYIAQKNGLLPPSTTQRVAAMPMLIDTPEQSTNHLDTNRVTAMQSPTNMIIPIMPAGSFQAVGWTNVNAGNNTNSVVIIGNGNLVIQPTNVIAITQISQAGKAKDDCVNCEDRNMRQPITKTVSLGRGDTARYDIKLHEKFQYMTAATPADLDIRIRGLDGIWRDYYEVRKNQSPDQIGGTAFKFTLKPESELSQAELILTIFPPNSVDP